MIWLTKGPKRAPALPTGAEATSAVPQDFGCSGSALTAVWAAGLEREPGRVARHSERVRPLLTRWATGSSGCSLAATEVPALSGLKT